MRVLAIDLGTKRIGTAVSDSLGISTRPVETIRRSSRERDFARLRELVDKLEVEAVVVGLPLKLDGTEGEAAARARRFAERLQTHLGVSVFTQDERLTSYEAEEILAERGMRVRDRKMRSDSLAAAIILRDYLSTARKKN